MKQAIHVRLDGHVRAVSFAIDALSAQIVKCGESSFLRGMVVKGDRIPKLRQMLSHDVPHTVAAATGNKGNAFFHFRIHVCGTLSGEFSGPLANRGHVSEVCIRWSTGKARCIGTQSPATVFLLNTINNCYDRLASLSDNVERSNFECF